MKDDRIFLLHILDALRRIEDFTATGEEEFLAREMIQDAVIRNLEIIGEATKHLSSGLRGKDPSIPWQRIAGMRDKLIHAYFGVKIELVWGMVEQELPRLRKSVEKLIRGSNPE